MTEQTRLASDELGPADADRVTLVHGFTQTRRCWGPVADDLARYPVAVDRGGDLGDLGDEDDGEDAWGLTGRQ